MSIPIYITNRDLLETTKNLVEFFQKCEGVGKITVIDCDSNYLPLLEWYRTRPCAIRYTDNAGSQAAWKREIVPLNGEYVVTDSDLDLSQVPLDLLLRLRDTFRSDTVKVGVSLDIDNIPENAMLRELSIAHEKQFWRKPIPETSEPELFDAQIDTTCAMYRLPKWGGYSPSIRLGKPYTAVHKPWSLVAGSVPPDFLHYFRRVDCSKTHWSGQMKSLALGLSK